MHWLHELPDSQKWTDGQCHLRAHSSNHVLMVSLPNRSALPTFTLFNMCKRAHRNSCLHLFTTILTSGVLEQDCQYMQTRAHENTQRANRAARLQNSDQQIQMAYTLKKDKYVHMKYECIVQCSLLSHFVET